MTSYSVGEVAELLGVPASTLRYYEAEGLLPEISRTESGRRQFSERDIETCRVIECLKTSGLALKDIRDFMTLVQRGDATLTERLALFEERRSSVLQEIERLQGVLAILDFKRWYYQNALSAGTEEVVKNLAPEEVPTEHRPAYERLKGSQ